MARNFSLSRFYFGYTHYDIYFGYSLSNGLNWYPKDIRLDTGDFPGANSSHTPQITNCGNYVYVAWLDSRNRPGGYFSLYFNSSANNGITWRDGPDEGDIMLIRSTDGGNTWNPPRRVNNDSTTQGQFQPWIDVKPNGVIDIVFYDRRNNLNNSFLDVYMATSFDRGISFVNTRVSDISFGPPPPPTVWPWPWIGEYIGIDVDSSDAYIAWTDTRPRSPGAPTGDLDIYFDRIPNPHNPAIDVISPNGGETWFIDEVQNITWTSSFIYGNVMIDISRDDGNTWSSIENSTPNEGTYHWQVTGPASDYCRIRISDINNPSMQDESDMNFRIQPGNTPEGVNVEVITDYATITFDHVIKPGNTTVTKSSMGPPGPLNFQNACLPPLYYDIRTTADYLGIVQVCIRYDDMVCEETNFHLFHYDNGWIEVQNTTVDIALDIVCGEVTHLSEFLLANCPSACSGDFDCDGDVNGTDLALFAVDFGEN